MERNTIYHNAHSTWRCQYHIVFASKFRRKVIMSTFSLYTEHEFKWLKSHLNCPQGKVFL